MASPAGQQQLPANSCKVCGGSKPDNPNVSFCSACKKFFLRNRSKLALTKCATGQRNCPVSWNNRRSCSYCRLTKCFAIGIRGRGRIRLSELGSTSSDAAINRTSHPSSDGSGSPTDETSLSSEGIKDVTNQSETGDAAYAMPDANGAVVFASIEKPPALFDGSVAEGSLRAVIRSATEMHQMDHTPMRSAGIEFPDEVALWKMIMMQMSSGRDIGCYYSSGWLDMGELDDRDVAPLIFGSLVSMGAFYMALPGNKGASMFGMNDAYAERILTCFPEFSETNKALVKLSSFVSKWSPSFVETSFLLAYLFFNDKANVECPERIRRMRKRLLMMFQMYLYNHSPSREYAEFAVSRFAKACNLIEQISNFMMLSIAAFAKSRPQLALSDSLFLEVFVTNFSADVMANNNYEAVDVNNSQDQASVF